jgi:hypothetical protein
MTQIPDRFVLGDDEDEGVTLTLATDAGTQPDTSTNLPRIGPAE